MNVLENIVLYYNHSQEKDIYHETAHNILLHLNEIEDATIYDVAEICIVSTTTISRFVRHLGYKNYAEFKTKLVDLIKNYHYHNILFNVNEASQEDAVGYYLSLLRSGLDSFEEELKSLDLDGITTLMHEAKKVNFFLYANSGNEFFLQIDLLASGVDASLYTDPLLKLKAAKQMEAGECAVIIMPNIRESELEQEILQIAVERGAHLILVSGNPTSKNLPGIDYHYIYAGQNTIADNYKVNLFMNVVALEYRHKYLAHSNRF